jgi:hypothetical protein
MIASCLKRMCASIYLASGPDDKTSGIMMDLEHLQCARVCILAMLGGRFPPPEDREKHRTRPIIPVLLSIHNILLINKPPAVRSCFDDRIIK